MKKSILAIALVFSTLLCMASCRKLDSENMVVETKAYIVDDEGVTRNVYNVGDSFYYYDADGNRKEASSDSVVIETNTYVATTVKLSPEQESFFAQFEGDSIEEMIEADETQVNLENDQLIPDDAFSDTKVEVDESGKPVHEDSEMSYEEILEGKTFTMDVKMKTVVGGTETVAPFMFMRDGENLYFETAMPLKDGGGSTRLNCLLLNGDCYIIIPSMRAYMKIPKETIGETIPTEAFEAFDEESGTYTQSYTVEIDGKEYLCDVYEDEGTVTKHYYLDGQLKRIETVHGEDMSIMEFNQVSATVDKSKFTEPKNYFDMTSLMGENFNMSSITG